MEEELMCTECNKERADWLGIDGNNLCQLCWEVHCSEEWWQNNIWQNGVLYV